MDIVGDTCVRKNRSGGSAVQKAKKCTYISLTSPITRRDGSMVACSSPGFEAGSSIDRGKLCQSLNVLPSEIALLCAGLWGAAEDHKKHKTPKIDIQYQYGRQK